jgi:large subunit ribosomal protein L25
LAVLQAEPRSAVMPQGAGRFLSDGILPIELLEKDSGVTQIQASLAELRKALAESNGVGLFDLKIRGDAKLRHVIVKKILKDDASKALRMLTLQEVSDDDRLRVHVPIVAVGKPKAAESGQAALTKSVSHLIIGAKLSNLPEEIKIDVSSMGLHDTIRAKDVQLPDGIKLLTPKDAVIVELKPIVGRG